MKYHLRWINGESISYVIPSNVTIHTLKYRETGYDTEVKGSFECDDEFLNLLWKTKSYVLSYIISSDGLTEHKSGSWDWVDWGDDADMAPMENTWYYMALQSCVKMAKLLDQDQDIALYDERIRTIKEIYNRVFLKDGYYYNSTANGKPYDRANALAVLSGLADEGQYGSIQKILESIENASPYMEKYVLDTLCKMGNMDKALERLRKRPDRNYYFYD